MSPSFHNGSQSAIDRAKNPVYLTESSTLMCGTNSFVYFWRLVCYHCRSTHKS